MSEFFSFGSCDLGDVSGAVTWNSEDFNRTDRTIRWWARAVCSELRTAYSIPHILGTSPSRRWPASVAL